MGICTACTIAFVLQILLLCRPLAFFWDKSINGKCGSLPLTYLIPGIIVTVLDVMVFSLPMPLLWKLNMPRNKKIGTSLVFGIGLGICLIAGVRLKFVLEIVTEDFTATIWMFAILGGLEPMLGILAACLPMVPPVLARFTNNKLMAWTQKGNSTAASKESKGFNSWPGSATRSFGGTVPKGMGASKPDHDQFERLSDTEYPLVDQQHVQRLQPSSASSQVSSRDWSRRHSPVDPNSIKVTTKYEVDSRPGRNGNFV
jgi:hypothetical protein